MAAYATEHSTPPRPHLAAVAASTRAFSQRHEYLIDEVVSRFLTMLVAVSGARRILEIGTFTGYSAMSMADAVPRDGHVTTLEIDPAHAAKAREHVAAAGLSDRVTIMEGPALESLAGLEGPYDLVFIDADKPGYPAYYEAVVPLVRPGGLIVADNVLRGGHVLDEGADDAGVRAMQAFNDRVAADPRVECVMLTVRDGLTLIRRRDPEPSPG